VRAARDAWFGRFARVRLDQLVFVDEFGAATTMQRTHGRAPPGQRVVGKVPHGHWKTISTIAALTVEGIVASASFDAATDTELFVAFVAEALAPALRPGQVVVMDNLGPHRSPQVRRLVEAAGARLVLLPPYSPDLNPIEQAWSKLKGRLRSEGARSREALEAALGPALATITARDARGWFRLAGYSIAD
jgi:transposase